MCPKEAGQVVWYSHLFNNFPQFVVIHTIKGFSIVNEAELGVFLGFLCFLCDPVDVDNFSVIQRFLCLFETHLVHLEVL